MSYAICPNCGAVHAVNDTSDKRQSTKYYIPCRSCKVNGELARLAWEAPRRNRYRRK